MIWLYEREPRAKHNEKQSSPEKVDRSVSWTTDSHKLKYTNTTHRFLNVSSFCLLVFTSSSPMTDRVLDTFLRRTHELRHHRHHQQEQQPTLLRPLPPTTHPISHTPRDRLPQPRPLHGGPYTLSLALIQAGRSPHQPPPGGAYDFCLVILHTRRDRHQPPPDEAYASYPGVLQTGSPLPHIVRAIPPKANPGMPPTLRAAHLKPLPDYDVRYALFLLVVMETSQRCLLVVPTRHLRRDLVFLHQLVVLMVEELVMIQ